MESVPAPPPASAADAQAQATGMPRPHAVQKGEVVEVTVDRLAYGGNGVARHEGYVLFVPGTLPGDRVRARVVKRKRAYGEAKVEELLAPGPDRIEPRAAHPGAAWQVLPYEKQLAIKEDQLADALQRIGHLSGFEQEPIIPAEELWGYRNKLEYSFGTGPDGELICGFHAPGSWEDIVDGVSLLGSERLAQARDQVLAVCRELGLTAYDRRSTLGFLRNLVLREGRRSGDVQVRLVTSPDNEFDYEPLAEGVTAESVLWTQVSGVGETTAGGIDTLVSGRETIQEQLCGLDFAIHSAAFFQTNTVMAEKLYGVAREYAGLQGYERVYDLFCGIGTIGLSLADKAGEVWGLEIVEPATRDAIDNAKRNDISNARFFAGDVRLALRELVEEAGKPDVLVVDPPRAGLSQKVVRRIIEAGPKRIVYVSCNPTTLAPNAAQLVEAGWVLKKVRPVDMFPQTPHIECVAVLDRA